ncbi:MAG: hypothetical protein P8X89_18540 [Reinekea sp.]
MACALRRDGVTDSVFPYKVDLHTLQSIVRRSVKAAQCNRAPEGLGLD